VYQKSEVPRAFAKVETGKRVVTRFCYGQHCSQLHTQVWAAGDRGFGVGGDTESMSSGDLQVMGVCRMLNA
jgi:hypothetical protein